MDSIVLKATENCRWDCVSLGEVVLRLDPGEERIHTAMTTPGDTSMASLSEVEAVMRGGPARIAR
jgi:hypothetical protein